MTYFDSSVLVAAMVEEEAHHSRALAALVTALDGISSTHAFAPDLKDSIVLP